ncbi:MAG TPA: HisA/HisF-related TIM barrel protein [Candidatus Limnocylindrales bacterium]|jgi:phosphoribosylformimino-5-aminoimidazole carboxamide ribotide isomerase|nr:HisA/HisF-related TIM barrel protein [Candidatus Limnocylindrales bacterium]
MEIVPSIDLAAGRSRLVFWPGAATGTGTPTDRPERIARHFVEAGAAQIHLVDIDGAKRGAPVNTAAVQAVARAVAVPLQLAGGVDGPEQVELAFAAGATRVVLPLWVALEQPQRLRDCLRVGGAWVAVGLDPRPDRLAEYPWRGQAQTVDELIGWLADQGVQRVVLSHGGARPDVTLLARLAEHDVEIQLAGGVTDPRVLVEVAQVGVRAVILGEALLNGSIDFTAALHSARGTLSGGRTR